MKTLKKLTLLAILALAPMVMFAADHIVFIHGWQMFSWGKPDTWDDMVDCMTNNKYGVPYVGSDRVLVVDYKGLPGSTSIDAIARNVWEQIKQGFPDGKKLPQMDFIVHSMGGLVLRSMVEQGLLPNSKIDHVVTLASPHYGQRQRWSEQQRNMAYGSEFLWDLANASKKIAARKVLCVVATDDDVVNEWSAALCDEDCSNVRYVDKTHSMGDGICKCGAGWFTSPQRNDVVYQLVTEFFSKGTVSHGARTGSENEGAVLFQVIDGKGRAVAYEKNQLVSVVKQAWGAGASIGFTSRSPGKSNARGIGAVYDNSETVIEYGLPAGSYTFDMIESKGKVFSAFTTDPIEVKRGRTTVIQIPAENVRPLDYVFLIDTTGSMGSHINSVKANAKNLIESQLLNGARNSRVAVVDYRDFPERTGSSSDYAYDVKCKFTSDAATAIAAINSLTLGYGGDGPETVYSGIHACIVGKGAKIGGWQENSVKTIMVMGDAKPLDPEPITGYTKSDGVRWANELKTDEDDEGVDVDWELKSASKQVVAAKYLMEASSGTSGSSGGVSIYPVVTSSSLTSYFSEIAEGTGGKVISASSYASVADAVKEVIEQSMAANGFETEIVTASETAGSIFVRVFGGSTSDAASVGYQVVSGSAVNGKDFTTAEGVQRLTWAEGERSYKTITIPVMEDTSTSNDKFFSIILCDPSNMGLGSINVCRINLLDRDSGGEYRVGDVYVQGLSRNSEMGTVSGSGFCAAGASLTLTATAKSGYVFTSWENGSMASRRSITASDASASAVDGVATYVASFISLADLPLPTIESSGVVTGIVGQAVSWGLNYYSMSEATVTCTGLPAGLTFADGVISGTPAKSGTSTLTFTARNAKGETSLSMTFVFIRDPSAPYLAEEGNEGEFNAKSGAVTYDGCLLDARGNLAGTVLVKVAKANARSGVSKITATVQPPNGKKLTFKGETADGRSVSVKAGDQTAVLTLGVDGMTGKFGDYTIDGSRNVFASKNNDEKSAANAVLGKWKAINAVWNGGSLSVVIAAKGKAKVTGTLSDGTKISAKGQLVIGTEWLCVPIVWAKQKAHLAFMLWMGKDGNDVMVEGLDNVTVGQPVVLKGGAVFRIDTAALSSILGDSIYGAYLPNGIAVEQKGTKWIVANGTKIGKVQLGKDGKVDVTKAGTNASGLKLTYKAKDGTFKGSFKAYANVRDKPMATTVNVTGVMIGDKGYGAATIKKKGSVTVTIE